MKFGGTSVQDEHAFRQVERLVRDKHASRPVVVVVSAMSRVTDALLSSTRRAHDGDAEHARQALDQHFARHRHVAHALLSTDAACNFDASVDEARDELGALLQRVATRAEPLAALQDEIVSYGERLSSALLAAVFRAGGLAAEYVDTRRCIITDDEHGCAAPLMSETTAHTRAQLEPLLASFTTPVLGGYIASTLDGKTTTLGRGGSDYTAAIIGAALQAREIQICTDVSGVLTADPRIVETARPVPRLSYAEAAELAYFGAKVLHPKTILPAVVRGIPVRICNTHAPEADNTIIYFDTDMSPHTVKAIAHKTGISIVHVTSARMLGAYGFLRALFEVFEKHRTAVDLVTTSEVSVSLSLEETGGLEGIVEDLKKIGAVKVEHGRALICVVGEGLRNTPGIAAKVFTAVRDINVMLISQGASNINLTFVIEEASVENAVRRLHRTFFEQNTQELYRSALREA
jgi:aspartate kinase